MKKMCLILLFCSIVFGQTTVSVDSSSTKFKLSKDAKKLTVCEQPDGKTRVEVDLTPGKYLKDIISDIKRTQAELTVMQIQCAAKNAELQKLKAYKRGLLLLNITVPVDSVVIDTQQRVSLGTESPPVKLLKKQTPGEGK